MMRNVSLAMALLYTGVQAQSVEERAEYAEMTPLFDKIGVTWESAKVKTEDGYTMSVFRITGSQVTGPYEVTKNAVILQHGMGGSAAVWLTPIRGETLATRLAEMGFDVWLANNSGILYSQVHDVYTVDDREFWDLPWNKFGQYDFPALTEHIQKTTGVEKVAMVGHSQGTTQTYAGMGIIPEWYDKNVSVAALMGPCTSPN